MSILRDTRAWSKKYYAVMKAMPNMVQAGSYSAVLQYLKAVQAAGTTEGAAVAKKMREIPEISFTANPGVTLSLSCRTG